ncbi:hypothetical protein SCARD494_00994 [Seiridium cardinale]
MVPYLNKGENDLIAAAHKEKQREIVRQTSLSRGELPVGQPPFAPESKAAFSGAYKPEGLDDPLPADVPDIVLSWHPLGLCKMTPCDKMGVVDASLGVYVTKHLKVADLSIVPGIVSGNPMNTACAIRDKAAYLILQELGLI